MKAAITLTCILIASSFAALANAESPAKADAPLYKKLNIKGKKANDKPGIARCVVDATTGLVWELKTDDDSIHDKDNTYRWGGIGAEKIAELFFDDWNSLVDASNKEKLCGFTDWRVPTIDELKTLVVAGGEPTINTEYFPLTLPNPYWSVSAYKNYPEHGQTVHFGNGFSYYYNGFRGERLPVRLVRDKLCQ